MRYGGARKAPAPEEGLRARYATARQLHAATVMGPRRLFVKVVMTAGLRRACSVSGAKRWALMVASLAGVFGLALVAAQFTPASTAHAAIDLQYQSGYYLDNGWYCYGWTSGVYRTWHCTQHWHRAANGQLVSDNTAWVPNGQSSGPAAAPSGATVQASAPAPVYHVSAPAPAPSSGSVASQILAVFGPYGGQALRVATCESSLNPNAYNRSSGASGVFQFLASTWATTSYAGYSPFNASANINAAHQVFVRDGYSWREWTCQP